MTSSEINTLNESVSALVDGEASDLEIRRVLKNMEADEQIQHCWSRYQMIGAVMRKQAISTETSLFADVSAAIRDEPFEGEIKQSHSQNKGNVFQLLTKTAIAASVAFAFVVGFQQLQTPENTSQIAAHNVSEQALPNASALSAPEGFNLPTPESRTVSTEDYTYSLNTYSRKSEGEVSPTHWSQGPEFKKRLNLLLLEHAQQNGSQGNLGLLPLSRLANTPLDSAE